jgi:hypothetical protein
MQMNRWPSLRKMLQGMLALMCTFVMVQAQAQAESAIFKCGNQVTNQPVDRQNCQKLDVSATVQIEGTRVQSPPAGQSSQVQPALVQNNSTGNSTGNNATHLSSPQISAQPTALERQQRQAQSRTILEDEWQKLSAQYAELVRIYNQGQPTLLPGETAHTPQYLQRVQDMQLQLQRLVRDQLALQRELSRYAKNLPTAQLKFE